MLICGAGHHPIGVNMSLGTTMSSQPVSIELDNPNMASIAKRQRFQDVLFHRITQSFSLLVLVALMGIIVSLFINAWPTFQKFGFNFIWRVEWDIINEEFGAAIAIVGTIASASIAMLIAVPLAFGIALFLTETCPVWLRRPLGTAVELLAAVPSIIYGMFGLFVFAPLFADYFQVPVQNVLGGPWWVFCSAAARTASASWPPASCWPSWCCLSSRR
jgi:phosphate transport system permease protein